MELRSWYKNADVWLVSAFDYLQDDEQFAVNGFKEAGILIK